MRLWKYFDDKSSHSHRLRFVCLSRIVEKKNASEILSQGVLYEPFQYRSLVWETNYLEIEWFVTKTGPQSSKGQVLYGNQQQA